VQPILRLNYRPAFSSKTSRCCHKRQVSAVQISGAFATNIVNEHRRHFGCLGGPPALHSSVFSTSAGTGNHKPSINGRPGRTRSQLQTNSSALVLASKPPTLCEGPLVQVTACGIANITIWGRQRVKNPFQFGPPGGEAGDRGPND